MAARRFIELRETPSTNSALRSALEHDPALAGGTVLYTHRQTAGRGQRGNSWEAEPGMNITMSMLLRPAAVKARDQFTVSECVALGVARAAARHLPREIAVEVKWPNDIYAGDRKLCGILIENSLSGDAIGHTVAGIGLNVNQCCFLSDAPNPVSMAQLSGRDHDITVLMAEIADEIELLLSMPRGDVHRLYMDSLWRREGAHPYATPAGERFMARIAGVAPDGMLSLSLADGTLRRFAFKEVAAVID